MKRDFHKINHFHASRVGTKLQVPVANTTTSMTTKWWQV